MFSVHHAWRLTWLGEHDLLLQEMLPYLWDQISPIALRKAWFRILWLGITHQRAMYQIIVVFCYLPGKVNWFFCELCSNSFDVLVTQPLRKFSSMAYLQIGVKNTEEGHTLMLKGTIICCMRTTIWYILNAVKFFNLKPTFTGLPIKHCLRFFFNLFFINVLSDFFPCPAMWEYNC